MVVVDCFQERLLYKIDKQIAEAEQSLHIKAVQASRGGPEAGTASVDGLHDFLIRMREHRRRVRRSFHLRQQSVTDSLLEALAARPAE
jgi:molybdenum-dependent DNA-binding transcriptional regulator ModE